MWASAARVRKEEKNSMDAPGLAPQRGLVG
jgi:hypothetical protein